jgi:WD40 repeat protein
VEFAPDSTALAVLCPGERTVRLWEVSTAKLRAVVRGVSGPLAFAPDGKTLVMSGNVLVLW